MSKLVFARVQFSRGFPRKTQSQVHCADEFAKVERSIFNEFPVSRSRADSRTRGSNDEVRCITNRVLDFQADHFRPASLPPSRNRLMRKVENPGTAMVVKASRDRLRDAKKEPRS